MPKPAQPHDSDGTAELRALIAAVTRFERARKRSDIATAEAAITLDVAGAKRACMEVGSVIRVNATFHELGEAVRRYRHASRTRRLLPVLEPLDEICQWESLRSHYQRLRLLQTKRDQPIATYLEFAREARSLANNLFEWFPLMAGEVDPFGCQLIPREREHVLDLVNARQAKATTDSLFYRAVGEARARGEAAFAIPRLEQVDRALQSVALALVYIPDERLRRHCHLDKLDQAISEALVLIPNLPAVTTQISRRQQKALFREQAANVAKSLLKDGEYIDAYLECGTLDAAAAALSEKHQVPISRDKVWRAVKRAGGTEAIRSNHNSASLRRTVSSRPRDRARDYAAIPEPPTTD